MCEISHDKEYMSVQSQKLKEDLVQILDETSVNIDQELQGEPNLFTMTSAIQKLDKQVQNTNTQLQLTNTQLDLTNSALILATRQLQEDRQNTQTELAKLKRQLNEEKQQSRTLLERLIRLEKNLIL